MTTNRLAKPEAPAARGGVFTAAEYAARAEMNGDHIKAKLWREADANGWDDRHYDPEAAAEHRRKIEIARGGR